MHLLVKRKFDINWCCFEFDRITCQYIIFLCTGAVGGDDDSDDKEKEEEAERERQEAIREAEERRKEKHRKMEEEREKMRQEIRDKVREFNFEIYCHAVLRRVSSVLHMCSNLCQSMHCSTLVFVIGQFCSWYRSFCSKILPLCAGFKELDLSWCLFDKGGNVVQCVRGLQGMWLIKTMGRRDGVETGPGQ